MLNRLTVASLLKTVILVTAFCTVAGFSINAWHSWARLKVAGRISIIADVSTDLFKAMHNLRTDRANSNRLLTGAAPLDVATEKNMRRIRDIQVTAMGNGLAALKSIELAGHNTLVPEFERLFTLVTAQQKEFWETMAKPKEARRPEFVKEYMSTTQALLEMLDRLAGVMAADVNHQDAMIDQLLGIKQAAWLLRSTAGDVATLLSNALAAGRITPEAQQNYIRFVGGIEAAWKSLEISTAGMSLPPKLSATMSAAKTGYFDPQYLGLRDRLVAALDRRRESRSCPRTNGAR